MFCFSCFPHVVNIAVKTGLLHLTQIMVFNDPEVDYAASPVDTAAVLQALHDDNEYNKVLKGDVVASARHIVTACRGSGQRREKFREVIKEGNADGWGRNLDPPHELSVRELLRDVDTRWSTIYRMIDRVLELYEVRKYARTSRRNTHLNHESRQLISS